MKIIKEDIDWAVAEKILSSEQGESLWNALLKRTSNQKGGFNFANVAYYLGAFIILCGMTWFMSLAWEQFGGKGLLFLACFYVFLFILAGKTLWFQQNLKVPGGLLFTVAVCMTPLVIYGLLTQLKLWPQQYDPENYNFYFVSDKSSLILIELGTALAGLVTLKFIKFPFLTAPITLALGLFSLDLTALLMFYRTGETWYSGDYLVSFWFGIVCLITAYFLDVKTSQTEEDYAFWLYLFGLMSFWISMTFMTNGSEGQLLIYFLINIGLMLFSVLLNRRVFIVFGGIGIAYYLYYLSYRVFQGSLLFPLALTVLGILVIYAGVQYQRNEEAIARWIVGSLPMSIRKLLPRRRC